MRNSSFHTRTRFADSNLKADMKSTSIRKFVTKILVKTRNAARRAFTRSSAKRRYEEAERVEKELIEALETQTDLDVSILAVDVQIAIEKEIKAVQKRMGSSYNYACSLSAIREETSDDLIEYADDLHTPTEVDIFSCSPKPRQPIHLGWLELHHNDVNRNIEVLLLVTEEELREKELEDKEYRL